MSSENISSGPLDHASERSNGDRRPPSPAPVKSSRRSGSRSSSPPRRRPRTPPSRDYSRGGGGGSYDRDRRRNFSPRRRNRSRSPEHRGGRDRDRRSRSTSPRGRRAWSPRGRRRPRTPPVPPPQGMNHGPNVPAYVPQPIYGDQYQQPYGQYGMPQYNAAGFAPNYGTAPGMNPYIGPSGYGQPGMVPGMNPEYMAQPPGWGGPQPVVAQPPVNVQDDAVALEMEQQKATLRKQREDYEKRRVVLRRELKILKEQRQKLTSGSDEPPSPTTKNFIKENDRLQAQIENKMSTIDNVIEMLTNIIGKEVPEQEPPPPGQEPPVLQPSDPRMRKREESQRSAKESSNDEDSESEKLKTKVLESMKQRSKAKEGTTAINPEQQVNYAFYDPELHWCKSCNVFPKTAKDYLQHLHSKEHVDATKKANDSPWHENNPNVGMPSYNGAPTRRTPIRGLQFFVPATAWYCKLCSTWMGDLHCASLHLKSQCHSDSIAKFVEHNPDFEVDWIAERQKSLDMQQGVISRGIVDPQMNGQGDEEGGHKTLFEGIPLQLNLLGKARTTSESTAKEPKKSSSGRDKKKKSSSKKEKKESKKKKTKSSKKRSSSTSSSSSSSDSDDDSSSSSSSANAEAERVKALLSLTKRQQQEQQEKQNQQQQQTSIRNQMRKMETEHTEDRRREEVTRRRGDSPVDQDARKRRRRSPEEERGRSRSPGGFDNNRYRQADRRRDRSRERQYRGRRDSRSRSPAYRRRRSRSRSRSRSPRRIEKPVVNYPPPFKPRVAEKKPVTMEKRKSPPPKKPTVSLPAGKKLPFIGRMPVFKKQGLEEANKAKEGDDGVVNYNPKVEKEEEEKKVKEEEEKRKEEEHLEQENHQQNDDDDDLMPDPEQLQRLMESERRQEQQLQQQQEEILPPGIDESESDLIPKPINDAPVPRRGPLPKDLEDALNIIFPGEKPEGSGQPERKPFVVTGHIKDNGTEIIMGPEPEDEVAQNTAAMYQAFSAYHQQEEGVVPSEDNSVSVEGPGEGMEGKLVAPGIESGEATGESEAVDMDELAMLGIDATDLAAQCV